MSLSGNWPDRDGLDYQSSCKRDLDDVAYQSSCKRDWTMLYVSSGEAV